jgi:hypothetical protein
MTVELIDAEETTIETSEGKSKTFVLGRAPATAGREILFKYPTANIPKLGDYPASEDAMLKLLAYCAVVTDGGSQIRLTTKALIDNHVPDVEMLARLEFRMLQKNFGFFKTGLTSLFSGDISPKVQAWISSTLTVLSEQLSQTGKQP